GVDVRLLLTGPRTDHPSVRYAGQRYYPRLLRAGVKVFEYQPCFLHLKMVLIDDWVSLGSCNFDHWNLRFNLEANLEALDPGLTRDVVASFERLRPERRNHAGRLEGQAAVATGQAALVGLDRPAGGELAGSA
ncbi:phospholipase D/transphosphatidylase, partial [Pseudomonas syringae pv. pisi str. 1704B]